MQAYKELQETNKRMAMEKRQREEAWRQDQASQDKAETTLTFHHEVMDATGKITRQQWAYVANSFLVETYKRREDWLREENEYKWSSRAT